MFFLVWRTVELGTAVRVGEGGGGGELTAGGGPGQAAPVTGKI